MEVMRCATCGKVRRVEPGAVCDICGAGIYRFLTVTETAAWTFAASRHTEAPALVRESLCELHTESVALV